MELSLNIYHIKDGLSQLLSYLELCTLKKSDNSTS